MSRASKFPLPITPRLRQRLDQFAEEMDTSVSTAGAVALGMAMTVVEQMRAGKSVHFIDQDGTVVPMAPPYTWESPAAGDAATS